MKKRVFLGGTWNGSTWRNKMMIYLNNAGLDYFNPIVEDWTLEDQAIEDRERETCDFCLYAITSRMAGVYSVAEVVDDSNKRPEKTVLVLLPGIDGTASLSVDTWRSLRAVAALVRRNGAHTFDNLPEAALWLGEK